MLLCTWQLINIFHSWPHQLTRLRLFLCSLDVTAACVEFAECEFCMVCFSVFLYAYFERGKNQAQAENFWIRISNINLRSYVWVRTCVLILFNMCRKYFKSTCGKEELLINWVLCKIICAFTAFGCLSILINNQINNTSLISLGFLKYKQKLQYKKVQNKIKTIYLWGILMYYLVRSYHTFYNNQVFFLSKKLRDSFIKVISY